MRPASHVDVRDYAGTGLAAAAKAVQENQLSAAAVIEACLDSVDAYQAQTRALSAFDTKMLRRSAYLADRMPARKRGPLHGIPVAFPTLIDCADLGQDARTVQFEMTREDAQIVALTRAAGASVFASTAASEFGAFGQGVVRHPFCPERSICGSGAAAAVAAEMVPLAIDVRADGPITRAAAYSGTYGLTVTRQALPWDGISSLATSTETLGLHVRKAEDIGFACRILLGRRSVPENRAELSYRTKTMKVCVLEGPASHTIEASGRSAINRAVTALSDARIETARLRLSPRFVRTEACYDTLFSYEIARRLTAARDRLASTMSQPALKRVDHGRRVDASDYEQARREAIALRSELIEILQGDTVFLDAATVGTPPLRTDSEGDIALHALWAIAGCPVLAVPCGLVDGLPVSVQIVAAPGREDLLARFACILEDGLAVTC